MDAGLTADLAEDQTIVVREKFATEIETVEDAKRVASEYAKAFIEKSGVKRVVAGQDGAPSAKALTDPWRPWTREKVNEFRVKFGDAELVKREKEIAEDLGFRL